MMSKNVIISDLDTNVKDGYKCHNGLWIWYRLGLIVYPIWIQMLMMGKNVMISDLDTNVKDGYKCNDVLWIWYRLGLIVCLIWILMLRMDTNVMMYCEFDTGWVWLLIWSGY